MDKLSNRLKIAMKEKNIKQSDLVKKTGINKGALSSYINGRYEPKQNNINLLANALGVSIAWLRGYDVPMNDISAATSIPSWYSWEKVNDDTMHNSAVDLINKIKEKYPNDKDIYMLISILSSYMMHIDNISTNNMITRNFDSIDKADEDILKLYFNLNSDGKKLVSDYLEMIHSKSEYISDDLFVSSVKNGQDFCFFFKNIDKETHNKDDKK